MNTLQLFKQAFFSFRITACEKMAFWKVILYAVFKCYFSTTYYQTSLFCATRGATRWPKIAEKLPDFSIENGTLQTKAKESGFIYQTDSIILRLIQMESVQPLMSKKI